MKDFCWLCLGDWKEHNSSTGGYYKCNKFVENKEENMKKKDAKSELARYMFYFERYLNHEKSQKHAITLQPVVK